MESNRSPYLKHLYVCVNQRTDGRASCGPRDAEAIREKLKEYVNTHGLKGKVRVSGSGCMDLCEQGANVMVYPGERWYSHVTLETVEKIIQEELMPLVAVAHPEPVEGERLSPSASSGRTERPVRVFLFDLGNVLVRFDHRAAAQKITAGTGASAEALFQLFFESPLVVDHDEGRISTRKFYEEVSRRLGLSIGFEQFLTVWNDIFTEDKPMIGLLRKVLQDYPAYLISNTNRPHFEYLRALCPVLQEMTGWILSYEVGTLKPNPMIYHRVLEMAKVPAGEIFYIDDREDLIEAGHRMGFQTHRFSGIERLVEDLKSRGVAV